MEIRKKFLFIKILLTLGALEFFGPILRDTNSSHLLNPEWVGHARFHLMWCISLWGAIGLYSIYLLWWKTMYDTKNLYQVISLQAMNALAFWSSTLLSQYYDGDIFDEKIHVGIMNINENIAVFTFLSLFLLFNFWFVKTKIAPIFTETDKGFQKKTEILKTDVLISGGGPSGMVAALYLSKLGIPNILVEKRKDIQAHPRAHELSSRSLEILSSLGISISKLLVEASDHETASRILFCNTINEEIGRIDLLEKNIKKKYDQNLGSETPYLNISQSELEKILREELSKTNLTKIMLEKEWKSYAEVEGKIKSEILDSTSSQSLEIESKYIIAADGASSSLRNFLGIRMLGPDKLQDVMGVFFNNDLTNYIKTKAKLYWIFNPLAPGVFIAHHPKKRWVFHHPVETNLNFGDRFDEEYFQEKMRIALGTDQKFRFQIESISRWRMTAQVAETFRKGNIFLIGDAAHRFPPTGGLGMNSGIADAHNLCWKLSSVIRNQAADNLLDSYESERKPVIETNCKKSRENWENILMIPKAMGINPKIGRWVDIFLNSWWCIIFPRTWKLKFNNYLRQLANDRFQLSLHDMTNKTKISTAVQSQIGHFDRIGLDLGYSYDPTSQKQKKGKDYISVYNSSLEIGDRFPHFWLGENKKISSHSLLSATIFTLIVCEESNYKLHWKGIQKEMLESFPFDVKAIPSKSLRMDKDGAVLIRPDGHIAWKIENVSAEKQFKDKFKNAIGIMMNSQTNQKSKENHLLNKSTKILAISLLSILSLFGFFLFRPIPIKPLPANFKVLSLSEGKFESFVPEPGNIYGMGLVYSNHIMETAASFDPKLPPPIFTKNLHTLSKNSEFVSYPSEESLKAAIFEFEPELAKSKDMESIHLIPFLDYEVELAFVLLKDIEQNELFRPDFAPYIGYFIANDLSARSLAVFGEGKTNKAEYWGVSKSFPGFLPISKRIWIPNIQYPNGLPDIQLETYVNGNLRQSERTVNMIYTPKEMLQFIQNKYPTTKLKKGDIIITGTPGGVAISNSRALVRLSELFNISRFTKLKFLLKKDDSQFLQPGDEVLVRGIGLGEVRTKIKL